MAHPWSADACAGARSSCGHESHQAPALVLGKRHFAVGLMSWVCVVGCCPALQFLVQVNAENCVGEYLLIVSCG
jgi:hypothetical protein